MAKETQLQKDFREAGQFALAEYPFTGEETTTERTVKLILQEGFVKGYMKGRS